MSSPAFQVPSSRLGVLMVVSGPSGTGKTTLCRKLCDAGEAIFSISCTTRAPRTGEVDGKDYFFLSEDEFVRRIEQGEFFEHAEVHGRRYGTLKSFVKDNLMRGVDVMMDIDVQGAAQVRACLDELVQQCLVQVFVLPPSSEELGQRLFGRGTENQAALDLRLTNAIAEMEHWPAYDYALVSGTRESDYERFKSLLVAQRMRCELQR
ncbi:MAG: guanylate kinase [Verrucomicrobiaceae bacterium]|nr:guanylate kinase [Verrucomicrobiaceae bacterium]